LSENIAALVLADKPVLVSDPFVATQLKDDVEWSAGTLEELADRQYFQLIVLGGELEEYLPESGRWPTAFIDSVRARYRPERRFDCPGMGVAFVPDLK
jgi:hypothetical protein